MKSKSIIFVLLLIVTITALLFGGVISSLVEKSKNKVLLHKPYNISEKTQKLHNSLLIGDLHADSTLWDRDLLELSDYGHVDIPRMQKGNLAIQMFTSVTKSPAGLNVHQNSSDAVDSITQLALVQVWPIDTWTSLTARAVFQAKKLMSIAQKVPDQFQIILTQVDLKRFIGRRNNGETVVAGLIGTEGSHALDGHLKNIDVLFDNGFRMMSLQHFFDNKLGGSLHGESNAGLTEFGREALKMMQAKDIMIDVAHSSEKVVDEVLNLSVKPLIVSHTGFHGNCKTARNISDELMIRIAKAGGIIGVGFWDLAVCDASPKGIVKAIRYGINLVGVDHVALGSDYDGSIAAPFDVSELAILTEEMLKANFTENEIRKVMGENMIRFLADNLPVE